MKFRGRRSDLRGQLQVKLSAVRCGDFSTVTTMTKTIECVLRSCYAKSCIRTIGLENNLEILWTADRFVIYFS